MLEDRSTVQERKRAAKSHKIQWTDEEDSDDEEVNRNEISDDSVSSSSSSSESAEESNSMAMAEAEDNVSCSSKQSSARASPMIPKPMMHQLSPRTKSLV